MHFINTDVKEEEPVAGQSGIVEKETRLQSSIEAFSNVRKDFSRYVSRVHDLLAYKQIQMTSERSRISFVFTLRFLLLNIILSLDNALVAFAIRIVTLTTLSDRAISVAIEPYINSLTCSCS